MSPAFKVSTVRALCAKPLFLLSAFLLVGNAHATSPTPFLVLTGAAARDQFGYSVAGVGDVNGDGYDDVLVGAPQNTTGHTGRAYVYFGGSRTDSIPDVVLEDNRVDLYGHPYQFGFVVAGVGDVNGDGRADIAVGEPLAECSNGAASIFWGGSTIHNHADLRLGSGVFGCGGRFGHSVSSGGDLNGDGYGDLLIGAPGAYDPAGSTWLGLTYIVYGDANPDSTPNAAIGSPPPFFSDFLGFGYAAVPVGDVNGDGRTDIVIAQGIGPPRYSPPPRNGAAFLYLGGKPVGAAPDAMLESRVIDSYPFFGLPQAVAPAGDLNGDGYDDFLVHGTVWRCSPTSYGSQCALDYGVFVYFGGPDVAEIPNHRLFLRGDYQLAAVAGGRDSNGDGYPDFVIGNTSGAYVYFGGPSLDSIPDVALEPIVAGSNFGLSVSLADVSGDGVAEVVVGAPGSFWPTGLDHDPGHVYVYDLSVPLRARAFIRDGHRRIPLTDGPSQICVQYQPMDGDYHNADVDLSSLRLASSGTGVVSEIPAVVPKTTIERDTDQDGIPELSACFNRSDLARVFSSVRGRHVVEVALEGSLESGRKFRAPLSLTILGTGKPEAVAVSVAPNPLNPGGTLTFSMGSPGEVTVRLFDLGGRSVRTVVAAEQFPAGVHRISIDGRDDRGAALASGVYFYRLETREGASTGRFVVLK